MFRHRHNPRALTLVEMLVAMAVLGILVVGLSGMVATIHESNEFVRRQGEALQHARVAIERIERTCRGATATADYPGFWTVSQTVGAYSFPDVLVVWSPPGGSPVNADGPPQISELVIYTYDDESPEELTEFTAPDASGTAPALSNTGTWLTLVAAMRSSDAVEKVRLTDLLRVADAGSSNTDWRGVIWFQTRYHPTLAEWTSYKTGSTNWDDMTWPLDHFGSEHGERQSWCAIELQLVPRGLTRRGTDSQAHATALFGSAALNYTLEP